MEFHLQQLGIALILCPSWCWFARLGSCVPLLRTDECETITDSVNTAARLAWKGYQKGEMVVCGEMFHKVWTQQCASLSTSLLKGGDYHLKGRPGTAPMFTPVRDASQYQSRTASNSTALSEGGRFIGRDEEMTMVEDVVRSRIMAPSPGEKPAPCMLLVQGLPGIGKSMFLSRAKAAIKSVTKDITSEPAQIILMYTKGDARPLSFCHQLLVKLLGSDEDASRASQFSALEVKPPLPSSSL